MIVFIYDIISQLIFDLIIKLVNRGLSRITTPFLCLHAEKDKLCSIEGSRLLHKSAKHCKDKSLIIFQEVMLFLSTSLRSSLIMKYNLYIFIYICIPYVYINFRANIIYLLKLQTFGGGQWMKRYSGLLVDVTQIRKEL